MTTRRSKQAIIIFLALIAIGFGVYFSGLTIRYYQDDFQFVFDYAPNNSLFYYFFHRNPFNNYAYRPIEASILVAIQRYFALNTLPIHMLAVSIHILLCWLIYLFLNEAGFLPVQSVLGALFMLLSQVNVHAVLSNDTLSQVIGAYTGCLSLWMLYKHYKQNNKQHNHRKWYILSLIFFLISLFAKETSVCFIPMILLIIIFVDKSAQKFVWKGISFRRIIVDFSPYLLLFAIYFTMHLIIITDQRLFGSRGYFHLGLNLFINLGKYMLAATFPISTVTGFYLFENGQWLTFSTIVLICLFFVVFTLYGLVRSPSPTSNSSHSPPSHNLLYLMGIFSLIGLFPVIMMNRVSELYIYNAMPFISVLIGVGLGSLVNLAGQRRGYRIIVITLICFLFISHIMAIQDKAYLMKKNGQRATSLLNQIKPYISQVPANGLLLLLTPPITRPQYSTFIQDGFLVLGLGLHRINQISGRNDITIGIIHLPHLASLSREKNKGDILILSLDDNDKVFRKNWP